MRRWLSGLSLLALWLLAGATLAGFGGMWWWVFDLFSHFRLQYLVVALLLALALLILGRRRSAAVAALLVCVNLAPIALLYWPMGRTASAAGEQTGAPTLRILSANVFKGNRQIDKVLNYVREENPDVVVLLEINERWVKPLERLSRRYPYRWISPGDAYTGIAVLSRTVPVETRAIDLGGVGTACLLVTLQAGGQRLSVLGTHLKAPFGTAGTDERDRELAALARVAREHVWPLVIVGDLNLTPFAPEFPRLLRHGHLRSCTRGLHPTWPVGFPPLSIQIDHCLATAGIRGADFKVGPDLGSDHYPISVRISIGTAAPEPAS